MKFIHKKKFFITVFLSLWVLCFLIQAANPQRAFALPLMQEESPTYIVQQGDTLNSIALRFGVSADDIQSANSLTDPNAIQVGQRLVIPGLEGISGLLTSEVLAFGTSLTSLSRAYQINGDDLITLNHLISPSEIIAGIKFIVAVNEEENNHIPSTTVAKGETSLEKAIQMGVSPWQMMENNHLEATWDMLPGEILYIQSNETTDSTDLSEVTNIRISPLPSLQGETLEIVMTARESSQFSGTFQDSVLHFFTDDGETYYSINAIHAMAETGPYPLRITMTNADGSIQSFEQLVLIASGDYGNDAIIRVDDIFVDPNTIAEEDKIINDLLTQYTSERYWEGQFKYPIDEPCINGFFGQRRNYNDGALYYYHTGVDFGVCAPNLNIYASAAGKVVFAEEMTIRGNSILIDHGWGVYSGYWHLSEFNVEVGDFVQPGDLLGLIGDTGRSLGPHLHFEIDVGGTPVNPLTWLEQDFP